MALEKSNDYYAITDDKELEHVNKYIDEIQKCKLEAEIHYRTNKVAILLKIRDGRYYNKTQELYDRIKNSEQYCRNLERIACSVRQYQNSKELAPIPSEKDIYVSLGWNFHPKEYFVPTILNSEEVIIAKQPKKSK